MEESDGRQIYETDREEQREHKESLCLLLHPVTFLWIPFIPSAASFQYLGNAKQSICRNQCIWPVLHVR